MNSSRRKRRNIRLLLTARGVRAFGDGFVSILLPVYLTGIGFGAFEVGALTTAMLLGPAMMTLGLGLIAHRLKTVRLLATATTLMVLSGIGYAFETEFWPLLIIALVGTLSPTASDCKRIRSFGANLALKRGCSPTAYEHFRYLQPDRIGA